MGRAALGAGATHRAFMCGQKALALRPDYIDAIALIGCTQYVSGHYAEALKSFGMIASDKQSEGFAWLMTARCYQQLGQADKAENAYRKAMQINPNSELGDFLAKGKDIH